MKVDESVRVPSNGKPEFVMTGIRRPGGGVRLYASRDLPRDIGWGQREPKGGYGPVYWHLDTDLENVLIIDKDTWGEAFARAFEIWANHDKAANEIAAAKALERHHQQMRAVIAMPKADLGGTSLTDDLRRDLADLRELEAARAVAMSLVPSKMTPEQIERGKNDMGIVSGTVVHEGDDEQ